MFRVVLTAVVVLAALPASAQQLSLDIKDGLVTLHATNASVRQVLAEWAKVGGTRVVGGDRLTGAPLTLSLEGVPEAKALDIVLRGAAGYMAAARAVPGTGRSSYDRILVLATSTPPAGGGASPAAGRPQPPRPFGVPTPTAEPDGADTSDLGDAVNDLPEAPQVNPFANAFGQPGGAQPFGQPPQANPFGQANPNPFGQPMSPNPFGQPAQPPAQGLFVPVPPPQQQPPTGATGFFGVVGSPTPGVVQQPAQPGVRPRPQG